jgi:hypothetical protein
MFAAYFGLAGSRGYFDGALPPKGRESTKPRRLFDLGHTNRRCAT